MDQSGPRNSTLTSPLIVRSDLQSPRQRTLYGALTLVFWVFWLYLWTPVLALLAWALGLQQAYKYMVVLEGYQEVIRLLGIYSLVILALGGGLMVWASYNILRFRGIERRNATPQVSPAQIGQAFGQDPGTVVCWQGAKRLYVRHDELGHIAGVDIAAPRTSTTS